MPFCPECKYEYREGCTECSDCRVPLVRALEEEKEEPEKRVEKFIQCWDTDDFVAADSARTALLGQGIPCRITNSGRTIVSAATLAETYSKTFMLQVPAFKEREARQIIKLLFRTEYYDSEIR